MLSISDNIAIRHWAIIDMIHWIFTSISVGIISFRYGPSSPPLRNKCMCRWMSCPAGIELLRCLTHPKSTYVSGRSTRLPNWNFGLLSHWSIILVPRLTSSASDHWWGSSAAFSQATVNGEVEEHSRTQIFPPSTKSCMFSVWWFAEALYF